VRYAEIVCTVKGGEVSYEWVGHWWQLAEISIQYANYFRGIEEAIKAFPWPCVVIRDDPFRLTVLIARKDHPAWLWHGVYGSRPGSSVSCRSGGYRIHSPAT